MMRYHQWIPDSLIMYVADFSAKVSDHKRVVEITLGYAKKLFSVAGIIWYGTNDLFILLCVLLIIYISYVMH